MPKVLNLKGLAPLFILIAVGVVILAGGVYVINKKYASPSNKLNVSKINQDTKKAETSSSKAQELASQPYTKASSTPPPTGGEYELGFSITPPAGWKNKPYDEFDRAKFVSPIEDTQKLSKKTGDSIYSQPAQVFVDVFVIGEQIKGQIGEDEESLKKLLIFFIKGDNPADYQISSQKYLRRDYDYPALQYEFISTFTNGSIHRGYGYIIKYGKYVVWVAGISLDSGWEKNSAILKQSVDTFKLL